VNLVNNDRARAGVKKLASGGKINNAALTRAREMARKNDITVRPDGRGNNTVLTDNGIVYGIAHSSGATFQNGDPIEIFQAFREDESVRKHTLSEDYTDIGVGIYKQGGKYYCVQILCGPDVPPAEEKSLGESWEELEQSLKELGEVFK
jgi:uncharacterized protein YkwD